MQDTPTMQHPEMSRAAGESSVAPIEGHSIEPIGNQGTRVASDVESVVNALLRLLDREEAELDESRFQQLGRFAKEKHMLLMRLETAGRGPGARTTSNSELIKHLAVRLDQNMRRLKVRMEAIQELTSTIEQATRKAESDGTYAAGRRGGYSEAW